MGKMLNYGVIGAVILIAGLGGYILLTDEQLDNAYYCTSNEQVGIFEYLSSTDKTGYWYEDGVRKQSTCRNGYWIPLREYCEANEIKNCGKIEPSTLVEDVWTGKYLCRETCEKIYD